ncbi:U-box domain-containing protein 21-like [Phoenix dactylifera]|uniref:U-box domain-containing protein n=1 Tax=Phoenix dactylifera TaxID=42345 RepID=A0A8B7D4E4_PHODC|nr:U-box domain-containing protein 21-like [Phoenix dactylifera]
MASARRALKSGLQIPFIKRNPIKNLSTELSIPTHFRCPISLELMKDPVTAPTGITYDRQNIETWLKLGNQTCPVTNQALKNEDLIPNHSLRRMIQDWCVAHRSSGVERIPTPRIPVTPAQVSELLSEIASSSRHGDPRRCCELAAKITALGRESERNRLCIVSCGSGRILSNSFRELARGSAAVNSTTGVMEEILSALVGLFPLDSEAHGHVGAPESLESIVSILKTGDLAGKLNAALVLKELAASLDAEQINAVAETDGLIEALVKLVEKPVSPQTTKTSLVTTFYLVSSNESTAAKFVDMGLVSVLLEILVDWEKSMYEKALGVLDAVLDYRRGREMAYGHSLTVPVLVKKMFRVSDMATEFAVSALWKLGKNYKEEGGERAGEEGFLVQALEVGAFQKLLLLLQVGCSGTTKEKASELLKLLNGSRERVECTETADFKGLKRPF